MLHPSNQGEYKYLTWRQSQRLCKIIFLIMLDKILFYTTLSYVLEKFYVVVCPIYEERYTLKIRIVAQKSEIQHMFTVSILHNQILRIFPIQILCKGCFWKRDSPFKKRSAALKCTNVVSGEGNLIFCWAGSWENYFMSVGRSVG